MTLSGYTPSVVTSATVLPSTYSIEMTIVIKSICGSIKKFNSEGPCEKEFNKKH